MKKGTEQVCNQCGKELITAHDRTVEGYCYIEQKWGYFSNKDGEKHKFYLCEECYDRLVSTFRVPVWIEETVEY